MYGSHFRSRPSESELTAVAVAVILITLQAVSPDAEMTLAWNMEASTTVVSLL